MEEELRQLRQRVEELEQRNDMRGSLHDYGVDLENINNLFETVTAVPSHTPSGVYDQIKIYFNSGAGTRHLYIYDATANTWYSVTIA